MRTSHNSLTTISTLGIDVGKNTLVWCAVKHQYNQCIIKAGKATTKDRPWIATSRPGRPKRGHRAHVLLGPALAGPEKLP
jgi:hypothetical protein